MGHQDVDAFRDEVPFIQQRLTPRQVEPPTVKPRSPAEKDGEISHRLWRQNEAEWLLKTVKYY